VKHWIFNKWTLGFLSSLIFAYVITNIFMDSLDSHEYDPKLGKVIYTSNTYYRIRREGWATTYIGKYNTIGTKDIDKNKLPKIAIWGDSEVTAFPLPDEKKMGQQVSEMFSRAGRRCIGFGIAHSDNNLADYIVDLRKYESLIPNIIAHYIVLSNLNDDTLPLQNLNTDRSKFIYDGNFRIIESDGRRRHQKIYYLLSKYNLRVVSYFFGQVSRYRVQFPWSLHQERAKSNKSAESLYDKLEAWEFILDELRKKSNNPITFLYCPYRPAIIGENVSFEDPQREDKIIFADFCRKHNIGFIDLTDRFNDFFLKTKEFPRGFANSFPGRGHININGHRIVAEAIFLNELTRN